MATTICPSSYFVLNFPQLAVVSNSFQSRINVFSSWGNLPAVIKKLIKSLANDAPIFSPACLITSLYTFSPRVSLIESSSACSVATLNITCSTSSSFRSGIVLSTFIALSIGSSVLLLRFSPPIVMIWFISSASNRIKFFI